MYGDCEDCDRFKDSLWCVCGQKFLEEMYGDCEDCDRVANQLRQDCAKRENRSATHCAARSDASEVSRRFIASQLIGRTVPKRVFCTLVR
jgi:hypothetical protein